MKKKIIILGSTGSIGSTTIKIISRDKKSFNVILLTANENYKKLFLQAKKISCNNLLIHNKEKYFLALDKNKNKKIKIFNKFEDFLKTLKKKVDYTICSITGVAGLKPTLDAIKISHNIAIANKESIICGWNLIERNIKKFKTTFIPIDSEHFSIWSLIKDYKPSQIQKIFITASGGPFLSLPKTKFKNILPKNAIKHPNWSMGKKISVDSATLMNKVLEITEALKLFPIDLSKYEIIVHPQSLVHAIVELEDGTTIFLYHAPDMKVPIGNAMLEDFNYFKYFKPNIKYQSTINSLHFSPVDTKKFPVVKLIPIINTRKSSPIIINAANEIFVDQFLKNNISFNDISSYLNLVLKSKNYIKTSNMSCNSIKNIYKIDTWARSLAYQIIKKKTKLC